MLPQPYNGSFVLRTVKDGGGIEVDYKVDPQNASPIEVILLNSGAYTDFAAEWSKHNELTDDFRVDDATYREFQRFVEKRQKEGDLKLEALYDAQLSELKKKLVASKFDSASRELEKLRSDIVADVKKEFNTYKNEIIEDLEQSILARYRPVISLTCCFPTMCSSLFFLRISPCCSVLSDIFLKVC